MRTAPTDAPVFQAAGYVPDGAAVTAVLQPGNVQASVVRTTTGAYQVTVPGYRVLAANATADTTGTNWARTAGPSGGSQVMVYTGTAGAGANSGFNLALSLRR